MLRPSQEAFEEHARRGNLVPLVRELVADMDRLSYLAAATLGLPARSRQSFLETDSTAERLKQARDLLRR